MPEGPVTSSSAKTGQVATDSVTEKPTAPSSSSSSRKKTKAQKKTEADPFTPTREEVEAYRKKEKEEKAEQKRKKAKWNSQLVEVDELGFEPGAEPESPSLIHI